MATRLQIVNSALREVGSLPINSLDDNTAEANLIRDIYELVTEQVLVMGGWTCLRRRTLLSRLEETPAFGFDFMYLMPTDPESIQILEFNRDVIVGGTVIGRTDSLNRYSRQDVRAFQLEGNMLLTNADRAEVVYIAKDFNEANWDSQLSMTVLAALKFRIAKNQSGEAAVVQQLEKEYLALLKHNKAQNNIQASSTELVTDTYFRGRAYNG